MTPWIIAVCALGVVLGAFVWTFIRGGTMKPTPPIFGPVGEKEPAAGPPDLAALRHRVYVLDHQSTEASVRLPFVAWMPARIIARDDLIEALEAELSLTRGS